MSYDRTYLVWALCYLAAGIALGIYMGASGNHGQLTTHAHILLVGFVASFVYATIHTLWLRSPSCVLASAQLILHQTGALAMCAALLLLYGGWISEGRLKPILGASALAVLIGALLMLALVLKSRETTAEQRGLGTR